MNRLKVAVVSSRSRFCDIEQNLKHFRIIIKEASSQGARLICFPELALSGYTTENKVFHVAQKVPGPITDKLTDLTRACNVYVSIGLPEKSGGKFYITQVITGAKGYIGKYRKHHPCEHGFSAGKAFPTFMIDGFKLGINICADGRYLDTIKAMKRANVDIIHHPHGNYLGLGKDAEEWTRGKMVYFVKRAIFARAYILISNSTGSIKSSESEHHFGSGAMIIDPLGQVVKRTRQKTRTEKTIITELIIPLSSLIPDFEMRRLKIKGH